MAEKGNRDDMEESRNPFIGKKDLDDRRGGKGVDAIAEKNPLQPDRLKNPEGH